MCTVQSNVPLCHSHGRMDHRNTPLISPLTKQQADAFAVVRPPNTLRDGGAHIDRNKLRTQGLVLRLRDRVGDHQFDDGQFVDKAYVCLGQ